MYKSTTMMWPFSVASLFKFTVLSSAIAALGLTGCSSTPQTTHTKTTKNVGSGFLDASSLDSLEDLLSATDMRAVEGDRLLILKHGDVWKRMTVGFKMDETHWDPRIEAQRSWFISRQPYLDRLSARASRYLYHTVKEAERRGLPTELALLPVIESSYDPAATSSAAAAGLWQFIPSTGRIYGLKQTSLYDGRRDVVESTRAAYEFLGSLYNQFGSWELALAAYNAGPGRIQQAINRNQAAGLPTDYWSLKLPSETMNYVPRFLAVAQIIKNPKAYGVSLPPIANRPHFREVTLNSAVDLNQISSVTGLSRTELYALNPGYRGDVVDPVSPMRILIPADLSPSIDNKLKALKSSGNSGFWASSSVPVQPTPSVTITTTRNNNSSQPLATANSNSPVMTASTNRPSVSSTVSSISSSMRKSATPKGADALAQFAASADIPSAPRIPVAVTPASNVKQVAIEPPISKAERQDILAAIKAEGEKESVTQALEPQPTQAEKDQVLAELSAIVPKGTQIVDPLDGKINLTAIQTSQSVADQQGKEVTKEFAYPKALADNVSASDQGVQRNSNKPYIKTDTDIVVVQPKGKRSTYTVVSGDTLAIIAMKNGVSWRDIANWNQIDPNRTLYAGTSLYLYDAKPQMDSSTKSDVTPESYTVKANDSLTGVAEQFGLTVKQLADLNDLSVTSGLLVGQKLALKDKKTSNTVSSRHTAESKTTKHVPTKLYTVKRGEYLKQIAERYGLSNQELADLTTGLNAGSNLYIGQKINVPLHEVGEEDTKLNAKSAKNAPAVKTENYKVQRGETLSSIATASKISLTELLELNNLKSSTGLRAGQTIKIPAGSTIPDEYVVQSGDSLNAVASKFNLQLDTLADLNGLNRHAGLRVGQKLKLTGEPSAHSNAKNKAKDNETPDVYTVKSGDTLGNIANRYSLQVDDLMKLNGLRSSTLQAGQKIKLTGEVEKIAPSKTDSKSKTVSKSSSKTEDYTVKAGESLHSISSRLGLSTKELADLNDLSARASLQRGQTIQIPKTVTEYKIKRGDTLNGLASKYGMALTELADLNGLKPSTSLRIGDVIKVPN